MRHPMIFADCVRGTLTLADGAWGTELQKLAAIPGPCLDACNVSRPDLVRRVAESYLEAGSRIILTNTFRSNSISLSSFGLHRQGAELNRRGVRISRQVAGSKALVFASIGPSGKSLARNEVTADQLRQAFSQQACALADEGPHALLIETMTDLTEARIAASAALQTGLPVIVSLVFDSSNNVGACGSLTTLDAAATLLAKDGVHGIGTNCGSGLLGITSICRRLAAAVPLPLWIKPNAGMPEFINGQWRYKMTPAEFVASAHDWIAAGATFLGGCCGTTPGFIRALAAQLNPAVPTEELP